MSISFPSLKMPICFQYLKLFCPKGIHCLKIESLNLIYYLSWTKIAASHSDKASFLERTSDTWFSCISRSTRVFFSPCKDITEMPVILQIGKMIYHSTSKRKYLLLNWETIRLRLSITHAWHRTQQESKFI